MITRYAPFVAFMWLLIAPLAPAQQKQAGATPANRIVMGHLANGAAVTFVHSGSGDWGLEIVGAGVPRMAQPKVQPGRFKPIFRPHWFPRFTATCGTCFSFEASAVLTQSGGTEADARQARSWS